MYKSTTDYSEVVLGEVVTVVSKRTANGRFALVSFPVGWRRRAEHPRGFAATVFPLQRMDWEHWDSQGQHSSARGLISPISQRRLGSPRTISSQLADPVLTMAHVHNFRSLQWCLVNTGACSLLPVPFVWVIYYSSVPLCPLKFITAFTQQQKARNYSRVW